jgi:hypothetical protein
LDAGHPRLLAEGMNRAEALYLPWTPDVIAQHLRGDIHIGLYPLDDDTCWWVAADFDKEAAMLDAPGLHESRTRPAARRPTYQGKDV